MKEMHYQKQYNEYKKSAQFKVILDCCSYCWQFCLSVCPSATSWYAWL